MDRISGTVDGFIYRNDENGYSVLVITSEKFQVTVTGTFPVLREGDFVTFEGDFIQHETYGEQFSAKSYEISVPQGEDEIEEYLASGIVRGIGPHLARQIVNEFGKETLNIIEKEPEKLLVISGIGKAKVRDIRESYAEVREAQNTVIFLQKFGISPNMAMKIFNHYGSATQVYVSANPYALVKDVNGIGFFTADKIAEKLGFEKTSVFRIYEGIKFCLTEAANNEGHIFLPKNILLNRAAEMLGLEQSIISKELINLENKKDIVICDDNIYHPLYFHAEKQVAEKLKNMHKVYQLESETAILSEIEKYEKKKKIKLASQQKDGIVQAVNNGICIITGGPGTGKTTTLDCLLSILHKRGDEIALAAPTGRAAKRMSSACGEEAKTIHRLLEYTKTDDDRFTFKHNAENPISCDICIIDEMSMIDIFLMNALLDGLKKGTRLVLLGDADQLPSVGAGNVLKDMIESKFFSVVKLTEIFRQAQTSTIVTNAHKINHGEFPELNKKDGDFFLTRRYSENEILSTTVDLCKNRLPKAYGIDALRDIQVLTPIKKGACGVFSLNTALQNALNPNGKHEIRFGESLFREGDKIIQVRNNYDREWEQTVEKGVKISGTGLFNGDGGIITEIDPASREVTVMFDDDKESIYKYSELEEISLAYALSVHKSQGCEFPFVVMPMPLGSIRIMTRNLFYTCVTRASRMVVLVGREESIQTMVNNNETQRRYSSLSKWLEESTNLL